MKKKIILNRMKGFYLLWLGLHLLLLLFVDNSIILPDGSSHWSDGPKKKLFFPFPGKYWRSLRVDAFSLSVYDYTEFLVYTIVPIILYFAYKLIFISEAK